MSYSKKEKDFFYDIFSDIFLQSFTIFGLQFLYLISLLGFQSAAVRVIVAAPLPAAREMSLYRVVGA